MAETPIQQKPVLSYVYEIAVDGVVRYVGKGTGNRLNKHIRIAKRLNTERAAGRSVKALKFHNKLAKALKSGSAIETRKVASGLSTVQAFELERTVIAASPSGQLWNGTLGGEGIDPETARRLWADPTFREAMMAIRLSKEFKERARQNTIKQFSDPDARRQMAERSRARWSNPEYAQKHAAALKAAVRTEEGRRKQSEAVLRRFADPVQRKTQGDLARSMWTDEKRHEHARLMADKWKDDPAFRVAMTAHWNDEDQKREIIASWTPEFLKKRGRAIADGLAKSEAHRKRISDPNATTALREGGRRYWSNAEARQAHSKKMKALWADPEHRAKTTAHWAEKRKARDDKS